MASIKLPAPPHILLVGENGVGKSTLAAQLPLVVGGPVLIQMFDPGSKDTPYLMIRDYETGVTRGKPGPLEYNDHLGINQRWVDSVKTGKHLAVVEYYTEMDPRHPTAAKKYMERMASFESTEYSGLILDSFTYFEVVHRMYHKFVLNPNTKEPRQWWASATDDVETQVLRMGALDIPVIAVAHVDPESDKEGGIVFYNPRLPGRMRRDVKSAFGEIYYVYMAEDDNGTTQRYVQTENRPSTKWAAATQWQVPDPTRANLRAIFRHYAMAQGVSVGAAVGGQGSA